MSSTNLDETAALRQALNSVTCAKRGNVFCMLRGKSVWQPDKGFPKKVGVKQIGSIRCADPKAECIFNEYFLSEYPEFKNWHVYREGRGQYRFEKKSEAELQQPSPEIKRGRRPSAAEAAVPSGLEQGRRGAVYLLRSFFESTDSGKILKELLPPYWYERLLLLLCTGIMHGFEYQELLSKCREFCSSHVGFAVDSFDESTLDGLIKVLETKLAFEQLFKRKAELLKEQDKAVSPVVYDSWSFTAVGGPYVNLLTLIDEKTAELYDVIVYPDLSCILDDEVDELAEVQNAAAKLSLRSRALSMVSSRFSCTVAEFTLMFSNGCDFLVGRDALKGRLKRWALEEAEDLSAGLGISIMDDKNKAFSYASTREIQWSYPDKTQDGAKKRSPLYLHFIFSQQEDREFMYLCDRALADLNSCCPEGDADTCADLSLSAVTLLKRGIFRYDADKKRYVYVPEKLREARLLAGISLLASSFCADPCEALTLYEQQYKVREGYGALPDPADSGSRDDELSTALGIRETCRLMLSALLSEFEQKLKLKYKEFCTVRRDVVKGILPENSLREYLTALDGIEAKRQADGSFAALDERALKDLSDGVTDFIKWLGFEPMKAVPGGRAGR